MTITAPVRIDAEQDQTVRARIQNKVAEAGGNSRSPVQHPERRTLSARILFAELDASAAQIERVIESGKKPLTQHALHVWQQVVDGLHARKQKLLVARLRGAKLDFVSVASRHRHLPGCRREFDLKGRIHADLPGQTSLDQVYIGSGVEEKTVGAMAIHVDAIHKRAP